MTKYEVYNDTKIVEFLIQQEAIAFANLHSMQIRSVEVEIPEIAPPRKTAKEYKDFSEKFLLEFSQDCIDAGNSIETNDLIELHFSDMNNALQNARLDKFYILLLASQPLLPFYTQEVKDRYLAKLVAFLQS